MTQSGNDLLMSGGVPSVKFDTIGDTVIGTIVDEPKATQMNKYKTDEPAFWKSGDPMMQVIVTIQTDNRDPGDPTDDGRRRLYITPRMMPPVREAIVKAGAKGLAIGGRIAVRWISGSGEGEGNARQFAADYAAPVVDPGSLLTGTPAAAPPPLQSAAPLSAAPTVPPVQAATTQAPPAMATPTAAPPTGMLAAAPPVNTALTPPPQGVDPGVWATLPEGQRLAVLAAMANPAAQVAPF